MGQRRIIVIGSSNTDMVVTSSGLPAPGQTILGGTFQTFAGGKGANQAVAAARAGGDVAFVCAVGDDAFGDRSLLAYRKESVDTTWIKRVKGAASGVALIMVDGQSGENLISVAPGANALLKPKDMETIPFEKFGTAVFQLEIPIETVMRGLRLAKRSGCTTILNPAPMRSDLPMKIFSDVDLVTPNEHELLAFIDAPIEDLDHRLKAARNVMELGVKRVVTTCGSQGALIVYSEGERMIPSPKVDAVDAVGAGDCFTGCLAVALEQNMTLPEAVRFACCCAAFSVRRPGAQASYGTRLQLEAFINTLDDTYKKVLE